MSKEETKSCQGCKQDFIIEPADFTFYEKMQSPAPKYCPDCREQRRLCFRNERTLYRRECSQSGKSIVSIYPENTPFPVYDQHVYWGDSWDALDYGQEYDPKRPFFEQLLELRNKVPRISLLNINGVNSDYVNNAEDSKNCYLVFAAQLNEDCSYGRLIYRNRLVFDSAVVQDSELCYECIDCRKCYQCLLSDNCESCTDLLLCSDMKDCQNCILSTNLRHQNYHILNNPVSKEEYERKKKEILSSHKNLEQAKKEYQELKKKMLVKFAHQTKCSRSTGDYMYGCDEVYYGFDTENSKNCRYIADAEGLTDCWDMNNTYYKPELNLDMMGVLQSYNVKHGVYIMYCSHAEYSDSLTNCENCFGCVGLRKKKYCILNKQYSKEEYQKLKEKIIEDMKKEEVYGDFLPPYFSTFGYNETLAQEYYSLDKKEAVSLGFNWQDEESGIFGQETLKNIPGSIEDVPDSIIDEALTCEGCDRNFRITSAELDFYRQMGIPLPHKDFECRHQDRMRRRNPRKLWKRVCMKEGCDTEFQTTYAPDRPEIVYCEKCYNQEVV